VIPTDVNQADLPAAVDFLGVPLMRTTTAQFIELLIAGSRHKIAGRPRFFTYINAWCAVIAQRNAAYRELLQQADGVYADGQAIVWASRSLGRPVPERVNAADFIVQFCRRAADEELSLYLVGSAENIAPAAAREWQRQVPALTILGAESGYFKDAGEDVIARINAAAPDILLVGLGVPLQEQWVASHLARLNTRVVWCVGAMFEYHGKARARAPQWMRRAGLEWFFRLLLEPRRLGRRYLLGNLEFLYYVARAKMRRAH
jgi:N-acetylglucosaminyldiphosphoundecaprenol N-acetyl-beta-D-mannosaminyltransferase